MNKFIPILLGFVPQGLFQLHLGLNNPAYSVVLTDSFSNGQPPGLPGGPNAVPPGAMENSGYRQLKSLRPAGESLPDIFSKHSIIILGEDHENFNLRKWLQNNMQNLHNLGVSYLAAEAPVDFQPLIDRYQKNAKDSSGLVEMERRLTSPDSKERIEYPKETVLAWIDMVKIAMDAGITVEFIDMDSGEKRKLLAHSTLDTFYRVREKYMAGEIARLSANNPDAKILSLVGAIHAHKSRIPALLLKSAGIRAYSIRSNKLDSFMPFYLFPYFIVQYRVCGKCGESYGGLPFELPSIPASVFAPLGSKNDPHKNILAVDEYHYHTDMNYDAYLESRDPRTLPKKGSDHKIELQLPKNSKNIFKDN